MLHHTQEINDTKITESLKNAPSPNEKLATPLSLSYRLLEMVARLSEESALNGRELAQQCGISPREAQKILPFLAKNRRVTRAKRPDADRGRYYYYWMNIDQRCQFATRDRQYTADGGERLTKENERLRKTNAQLRARLKEAQSLCQALKD